MRWLGDARVRHAPANRLTTTYGCAGGIVTRAKGYNVFSDNLS